MQTEPTEAERKEISDCLATVADRFKLYFEKAGIAYLSSGYLEKVAAAVGLKTYTVRSCFKGERLTTLNLIKLANYLHISTDYLLGLADDPASLNTYSDLFYYCKIMIDMGMLEPAAYQAEQILTGLGEDYVFDANSDVEIPASHVARVDQQTFALTGKFATLIKQYLQIARILQYDGEHLKSWRDITRSRLSASYPQGAMIYRGRFKDIQDSRKVSISEIQGKLGLDTPHMISKYRKGDFPIPSMVQKISRALNVSSDHLLGLTCNFNHAISEQGIFDVLIWLSHQRFFDLYKHPNDQEEKVILLNSVVCRFFELYYSRSKVCSEAERLDFFEQIRYRLSYPIITPADMPKFNAIVLENTTADIYYMEDYADRIRIYYDLYPIQN